jgi:hypothetical protein
MHWEKSGPQGSRRPLDGKNDGIPFEGPLKTLFNKNMLIKNRFDITSKF